MVEVNRVWSRIGNLQIGGSERLHFLTDGENAASHLCCWVFLVVRAALVADAPGCSDDDCEIAAESLSAMACEKFLPDLHVVLKGELSWIFGVAKSEGAVGGDIKVGNGAIIRLGGAVIVGCAVVI